jgi:hypothetical protein
MPRAASATTPQRAMGSAYPPRTLRDRGHTGISALCHKRSVRMGRNVPFVPAQPAGSDQITRSGTRALITLGSLSVATNQDLAEADGLR